MTSSVAKAGEGKGDSQVRNQVSKNRVKKESRKKKEIIRRHPAGKKRCRIGIV